MNEAEKTQRTLRAWELVLKARTVDLSREEVAEITALQRSCSNFPHKRESIDSESTQCGNCGAQFE